MSFITHINQDRIRSRIANMGDDMPTTGYTTAAGTQRTYRFEIGPIDWDGRRMNAVVIGGFPLEGGFMAEGIAANRILADHPDISAEPAIWAVFVKVPSHLPVPEWQFLGSGSGRQRLPDNQAPSGDIPPEVIRQLKEIFRP
jgi:hypothetical protein